MTKRRPLSILILASALVGVGGCVSSRARDWAQTAPVLAPDVIERSTDDVHLGVRPAPARDDR